jgi:Protein of unknown function (DUF2490)
MMRQCIVLLFVLLNNSIEAQRPVTGGWFTASMPVNFSKKLQWHNDAGYRTFGESITPMQFFVRTGIRHSFSQAISGAGGVAFFFTKTTFDKSDKEFGKEFRTWQELTVIKRLSEKLSWINRVRTEQRFFANTEHKSSYTAHRFRLRTMFQQKISSGVSLQLSNEYMNRMVKSKMIFDQNRLAVSLVYRLKGNLQLQPGYMWLKWPEGSQHILMITLQKNIFLKGGDKN